MRKFKKSVFTIAALFLSMSLCACGEVSKAAYETSEMYVTDSLYSTNGYMAESYADKYSDYSYSDSFDVASTGSDKYESNNVKADTARKLIKNYNLNVETEEFDSLVAALEERISFLGGYIQNLDTYNGGYKSGKGNRYSRITARIPVSKSEAFIDFVGNNANITSKDYDVTDVTLDYVDKESRKATYEVEQTRLLALLEKAETINEILTIESRLSEVRYQLESMESQLRTYDNLIDYSTIYISVSEVTHYTAPEPVGFGERISRSFADGLESVRDGLKEFMIDFVYALPGLVLFLIIVVVIVLILVAIIKGCKKRNSAKVAKRSKELMERAKKTAEEKASKNE